MKLNELLKTLSSYKKLFGNFEPHQLDYFLKTNAASHYEAKKCLAMGGGDWSALKKYSQVAKYYEDHVFYSMAVANVCRIISPIDTKKADFVGRGFGKNTLDSYRKVQLRDGCVYFEKVYKNSSDDFQKIKFFVGFVFPQLAEQFRIPKARFFEGERGSIVLFDWLERIVPVDKKNIMRFYADFRMAALAVDVPREAMTDVVCDFTREPMFQSGCKSSSSWLKAHSSSEAVDLLQSGIEYFKSLPVSERVFTHGDIIPANTARDGVVIDFDKCGFYPAGYELAYLASKSLAFDDLTSMESYLGEEIQRFSVVNQAGFYLFAFIYYSRRVGVKATDNFLSELWSAFLSKAQEAGVDL